MTKGASLRDHPPGNELLHHPRLNKPTAFIMAERGAYRPEGLLPSNVSGTNNKSALEPHSEIRDVSLRVAERVTKVIFDQGLAGVARPDGIGALIHARAYHPVYPE